MRLLAVTLVILAALSSIHPSQANMPCAVQYQCSFDSDPVWAADGNLCLGFRNPCYLASENCDRQNRYQETLQVISRDECQNNCPDSCPDDDSPVCGYTDNNSRTFANRCEMDKYSCESGSVYELYSNSPCSWD